MKTSSSKSDRNPTATPHCYGDVGRSTSHPCETLTGAPRSRNLQLRAGNKVSRARQDRQPVALPHDPQLPGQAVACHNSAKPLFRPLARYRGTTMTLSAHARLDLTLFTALEMLCPVCKRGVAGMRKY